MNDDGSREEQELRIRQLEQQVRELSDKVAWMAARLDSPGNPAASPQQVTAPFVHEPETREARRARLLSRTSSPETWPEEGSVRPAIEQTAAEETPAQHAAFPPPLPESQSFDFALEEESPADERDWRDTLRQLNLWPPTDEGTVEVQLGAWWATRIGALLAVIAAVFFGVYMAQHTTPWVRFLELCAVTMGVIGGGHWLEKRQARFGAVVFSAGLAMAFFVAFAAHALPAVRVIESLAVAGLAQGIVVGGIIGCAIWKNRENLATLAVLFGFVSCFFSFLSGLPNFSFLAAGLLGVVGVALLLAKGWTPPFVLSVPLAHALGLAIVHWGWNAQSAPGFPWLILPSAAFFALFAVAEYRAGGRNVALPQWQRRLVHGANLAGAIGVGYLATRSYANEQMAWFYLVMTALTGAVSLAYYRRDSEDEVGRACFVAAISLFALYLIEALDARTRWLAMAVEALVTLATARRTKMRTAEWMTMLVWLGSLIVFMVDRARALDQPPGILSLWGLSATLYVLLSAVMAALQGRWLANFPAPWLIDDREQNAPGADRSLLNAVYALLVGSLGAVVAGTIIDFSYFPATAMGAAILVFFVGTAVKHWIPTVAAALPFVAGQAAFWLSDYATPEKALWTNGLAVIALPLGLIAWIHQWLLNDETAEEWVTGIAKGLGACALISIQMLMARLASAETFFVCGAILSLAVLLIGARRPFRYAQDLVAIPLLLSVAGPFVAQLVGSQMLPVSGLFALWWIGAGLAMGVAALYDCWPALQEGRDENGEIADLIEWCPSGLALLAITYPIQHHMPEPGAMIAVTLFGSSIAILGWRPGWFRAHWMAGALFVLGCILGMFVALERDGSAMIASVILMTAAAVGYVVLLTRRYTCGRPRKQAWGWVVSGAALACLFVLAARRTGEIGAYATAFWGLSSAVFLAVGIAFRTRALRLVGLLGMALCVTRAFLVDIHSTFYRIAAFAILGVTLLIVGFLYHRFREMIQPSDEEIRTDEEIPSGDDSADTAPINRSAEEHVSGDQTGEDRERSEKL